MDDGGGRWLTYTEAGGELGIKPEAIRSLARRRRWPRQSPNEIGGYARVLVPGRDLIGASTRRSRPDGATGERFANPPDDDRAVAVIADLLRRLEDGDAERRALMRRLDEGDAERRALEQRLDADLALARQPGGWLG